MRTPNPHCAVCAGPPIRRIVWHTKLTQEERGAQCYAWAREYPALADDLQAVVRRYGTLMYLDQ